jgi:hypothetical protein
MKGLEMRKVGERAVARRAVKTMVAAGAVVSVVLSMVVVALPASARTGSAYQVRQILSGASLHHWYTRAGSRHEHSEPLTQPDDITMTGGNLFTGFGTGPSTPPITAPAP